MRYGADARACSSCGLKMDGTPSTSPPSPLYFTTRHSSIHPSIRPRIQRVCVGVGMMRGVGEGDEERGGVADAKIGAALTLTELFYFFARHWRAVAA